MPDFNYGYRQALADGVVRPVVFAAYTGTSRWRNSAGEVVAASLSEPLTASVEAQAWRTALDPGGRWVPHVIAAMDDRIRHLRASGMPDAAGLVLASDQEAARAYAKIAKEVTGEKPVLIMSDDPKASAKIARVLRSSTARIAVCVRMISEGVDIPRAACLAWLTSYRTPLFFAQAVGRVVRARQPGETATVFLPAVRPLLTLAAELESERDRVVRLRRSTTTRRARRHAAGGRAADRAERVGSHRRRGLLRARPVGRARRHRRHARRRTTSAGERVSTTAACPACSPRADGRLCSPAAIRSCTSG